MNPIRFGNCNIVMKAPADMPNCTDVHACRTTSGDRPVTVTAWRPSPEELVKINLGEPVWLVIYMDGMPPVSVTADDPFVGAEAPVHD
jgi:hypothetical protein